MKKIDKIIQWTLPLALSITIICFAALFSLYFRSLYYWDIHYLSITQSSHMDEESIKDNYNTLIDYLTNEKVSDLELPSFEMSPMGRIHFEDVKNIFIMLKRVLYTLGAYSIIGALICVIKRTYLFLKHTAILVFVIPITILAIAMINFDKSFIIFHQLAFRNDYWVFDPAKDPVIAILPQEFFMHSFILIISIVVLIACLLISVYLVTRNNKKQINK